MKTKYILISFLISVFCLPVFAANTYTIDQNYKISITTGYVNSMNETWNVVSTVTDKPLIISYSIGTELTYDYLTINNVDNNGVPTTQLLRISGTKSGFISTTVPNGRIQIVFTSDGSVCYANNPSAYSGINVNISVIDNQLIGNGSFVNGNSCVSGNVGVGTFTPFGKLDVNGIGGLVVSGANLDPTFNYSLAPLQNTMKMLIGANRSGGNGEINLVSNRGGGSIGGFSFYDYTNAGALNHLMAVKGDGTVGIGTTTPRGMLEVFGNNTIPKIALRFTGANQAATNYIQSDTEGHYLEFGTYGTSFTGSMFGLSLAGSTSLLLSPRTTGYGMIGTTTAASMIVGTNNAERMRIDPTGKVGIGTTTPDSLLTVKGSIHARGVLIDMNGALVPDFVFDDNYKLMPLNQVEQFVKTNNHLPEIPSASEVSQNGINVGDMQNKLLQKIEELTLYMIEQQKTIDAQSAQISKQSAQIGQQNAKIGALEKKIK